MQRKLSFVDTNGHLLNRLVTHCFRKIKKYEVLFGNIMKISSLIAIGAHSDYKSSFTMFGNGL